MPFLYGIQHPARCTLQKKRIMATQLRWATTCDADTVKRAWTVFNGSFKEGDFDFGEFAYALQSAGHVCAKPLDVRLLTAENVCPLNPPDEAEAQRLAAQAGSVGDATELLQPLVVGQFGSRIVILDGMTRYRAAEICGSDIVYVCVDMDASACMSVCMPS